MVSTENTIITLRYTRNDNFVPSAETTGRLDSNASRVDLPPLSLQLMPLTEGTPIPNSPYTFQHELLTELHVTRDSYLIQSALVDEDGYGITFDEAYLDFLGSIRDRYDSMKKREPRLSSLELQILNNLRILLEPS